MTSPAVTIRSAVGLLLFISPVNAAFHPPRVIAAENIETEKYPPFREWRIPFFIKKLFDNYLYNTTKYDFFQQSYASLIDWRANLLHSL